MTDDGGRWRVEHGDTLAVLERMPDASVDAIVTDPPYGLSREPDIAEVLTHWLAGDDYKHRGGGFMGQQWDAFVPGPSVWREALRVLKPGGFLLAFGGTRTYDLLVIALRLAGFEIRDRVLTLNGDVLGAEVDWLYGAGWPKSRNIGKAIDARAGAERPVIGTTRKSVASMAPGEGNFSDDSYQWQPEFDRTAPATLEAAKWEGWGTALKPAHEPIVVARKPFRGTVEAQVLATGTGALNIDACRIATGAEQLKHDGSDPAARRGVVGGEMQATGDAERNAAAQAESIERANRMGRWPANVALVHAPGCELVGERRVPTGVTVRRNVQPGTWDSGITFTKRALTGPDTTYGDGDGLETIEAWQCEIGCPVALLDELSGDAGASAQVMGTEPSVMNGAAGSVYSARAGSEGRASPFYGDTGGASRFFYSGKASPLEREAGLDELPIAGRTDDTWGTMQTPQLDRAAPREIWQPREVRNRHPTVKPIDLMRWLVRLVARPGAVVLDTHAGSGSTGCAAMLEGCEFIGIDDDEATVTIARARIRYWAGFPVGTPTLRVLAQEAARRRAADEATERRRELAHAGQLDLLASQEVDPHG